jgi:hypothetical protein
VSLPDETLHLPGKYSIERPGFNPQALAREPGSQRSGAYKAKKGAHINNTNGAVLDTAAASVLRVKRGADHKTFRVWWFHSLDHNFSAGTSATGNCGPKAAKIR